MRSIDRREHVFAIAIGAIDVGAGEDREILIAAVAADGGAVSRHGTNDRLEHRITDIVAVGVVRRFQSVDVDHDNGTAFHVA